MGLSDIIKKAALSFSLAASLFSCSGDQKKHYYDFPKNNKAVSKKSIDEKIRIGESKIEEIEDFRKKGRVFLDKSFLIKFPEVKNILGLDKYEKLFDGKREEPSEKNKLGNPELNEKGIVIKRAEKDGQTFYKLGTFMEFIEDPESYNVFYGENPVSSERLDNLIDYFDIKKKEPKALDSRGNYVLGLGYFNGPYGKAAFNYKLDKNTHFSGNSRIRNLEEYHIDVRLSKETKEKKRIIIAYLNQKELNLKDVGEIIRRDIGIKKVLQKNKKSAIYGITLRNEKNNGTVEFEKEHDLIPEIGGVTAEKDDFAYYGKVFYDETMGASIGIAQLKNNADKTKKNANEVLTERLSSPKEDFVSLSENGPIERQIDFWWKYDKPGTEYTEYLWNGRLAAGAGYGKYSKYVGDSYGEKAYVFFVVGTQTFGIKNLEIALKFIYSQDEGFGLSPYVGVKARKRDIAENGITGDDVR